MKLLCLNKRHENAWCSTANRKIVTTDKFNAAISSHRFLRGSKMSKGVLSSRNGGCVEDPSWITIISDNTIYECTTVANTVRVTMYREIYVLLVWESDVQSSSFRFAQRFSSWKVLQTVVFQTNKFHYLFIGHFRGLD